MGSFNEIQKGLPDLGTTYWQELKSGKQDDNTETDIVKMNCQTIFTSEYSLNERKNNPSIFENQE